MVLHCTIRLGERRALHAFNLLGEARKGATRLLVPIHNGPLHRRLHGGSWGRYTGRTQVWTARFRTELGLDINACGVSDAVLSGQHPGGRTFLQQDPLQQ